MGYFYDWVDARWHPLDHYRRLTAKQQRRISRRLVLIDDLLTEIAAGRDSVTKLYASLLATALIKTDQILMQQRGKEVVEQTRERQVRDRVSSSTK